MMRKTGLACRWVAGPVVLFMAAVFVLGTPGWAFAQAGASDAAALAASADKDDQAAPMNAGGESGIKKVSRKVVAWVKEHPYWAGGIGLVLVGGVILAASGGGGGSSSSSDGNGGGGSFAGTINGRWSGVCDGEGVSGSFTMIISSSGSVSGSYSGSSAGGLTGTVDSSGAVNARGTAGWDAAWSGTVRRSGGSLSGSGTWNGGSGCTGSWSGSGR